LRRLLARIGADARYQAPVREDELKALAGAAGLRIAEARSFNTHLKELYKLVPDRQAFAELWLRLELELSDAVDYRDEYAPFLRTRNVILSRVSP
jgi:hypothetical protein